MSGWLIALIAVGGVLLLLLLLLLFGMARLRVTCREDVWVSLRVLGLRFRLYPRDDGSGDRSASAGIRTAHWRASCGDSEKRSGGQRKSG